MKPKKFNSECPKCGEGIYSLSKFKYCWRHLQQKCPIWSTYGGEHLHRTCTCEYVFAILPKDHHSTEDEMEWLNNKIDEIYEQDIFLLADEEDENKRSDIG